MQFTDEWALDWMLPPFEIKRGRIKGPGCVLRQGYSNDLGTAPLGKWTKAFIFFKDHQKAIEIDFVY